MQTEVKLADLPANELQIASRKWGRMLRRPLRKVLVMHHVCVFLFFISIKQPLYRWCGA